MEIRGKSEESFREKVRVLGTERDFFQGIYGVDCTLWSTLTKSYGKSSSL